MNQLPSQSLIFLQDLTSKPCSEQESTELWLWELFCTYLQYAVGPCLIYELTLVLAFQAEVPLPGTAERCFLFHNMGMVDTDAFQMKQLVKAIKRSFQTQRLQNPLAEQNFQGRGCPSITWLEFK